MSSLAWVVSKSYMWEHAYAYLGICNSMQMCASFVFMQKYAHILFSLNLPYILAYRPSNFGQYFFPKLMGRLIREPTFNINKGHLFWTFLQPNLGGRLIFGSAYMRVYTVLSDKCQVVKTDLNPTCFALKVEKIENSKKRKEREARARELYEKIFPELRKQREDKERDHRLGTRGAVRSEADIEDVIERLQEQEVKPD